MSGKVLDRFRFDGKAADSARIIGDGAAHTCEMPACEAPQPELYRSRISEYNRRRVLVHREMEKLVS